MSGWNDSVSTLTLPVSGAYTVLVRDRDNNNTGGYSLTLDSVGGCFRLLLGSSVVRTQEVACLSLRTFSGFPAVALGFTLQAPSGHLGNLTLNTGARFTNATVTGGPGSQWFINLRTSPTNYLLGDEFIGSLSVCGQNQPGSCG